MKIQKMILVFLFITINCLAQTKETITFPSLDGLTITADTYIVEEDLTTPFIILLHQAGWSRGEYLEIAPKLNNLDFNCMAIDQRSGDGVNDVDNETTRRAEKKELGTQYLDTQPDIRAAIDYAKKNYSKGKIIIWGSSYSAALVLKISGDNPELVDGVLAFSPGEYYVRFGKPSNWIEKSAKNISVPVFITSAKEEEKSWKSIFESIKSNSKIGFVPETKGNHGSRALWEKFEDNIEYWNAVKSFLNQFIKKN